MVLRWRDSIIFLGSFFFQGPFVLGKATNSNYCLEPIVIVNDFSGYHA
jgi:hypothetical protein